MKDIKDLERYARQIILNSIDIEGQNKLFNSKVALVGLGGLGSPVALMLTGMGIGYLKIVDRDLVSLSDLNRQFLYKMKDIGKFKVEAALERLKEFNPDVKIEAFPVSITEYNVEEIVKDCDIVLDCTDSIFARYLLNRACLKHSIPYLYGAAIENQGMLFTVIPGKTACLECLFPDLKDEELPKCAVVGVNPPVLSLVASIQVSEAIRILTGKSPILINRLLLVDIQNLSFDFLEVKRNEECKACSKYPEVIISMEEKMVKIGCAREGKGIFYITPYNKMELDLDYAYDILLKEGFSGIEKNIFSLSFYVKEGIKFNLNKFGFCVAEVNPLIAIREKFEEELVSIYEDIIFNKIRKAIKANIC